MLSATWWSKKHTEFTFRKSSKGELEQHISNSLFFLNKLNRSCYFKKELNMILFSQIHFQSVEPKIMPSIEAINGFEFLKHTHRAPKP